MNEKELKLVRLLLSKLITDVMTGKFGTKNRSELISRLQGIFLKLK
jgi:hypothetical protein